MDFLARSFRVSDGIVRNIAFGAAYMAADDDPVGRDCRPGAATEREYQRLGHLCLEAEFGPNYKVLSILD